MNKLLYFMFLFFVGSILGYFLELFYRRIRHKKWINPGFFVGPYLPIYGSGLCIISLIYNELSIVNLSGFVIILLIGISMTLIELITGLIFLKFGGIRLWDYSNMKYNYQGIICIRFFLIWMVLGGIYYYLLADKFILIFNYVNNNQYFSFILGVFFGLLVIDFIYSTNILVKIREFVIENNLIIKYEELKNYIKEVKDKKKEKYSFLFPFNQPNNLIDYLKSYNKKNNKRNKRILFNFLYKK